MTDTPASPPESGEPAGQPALVPPAALPPAPPTPPQTFRQKLRRFIGPVLVLGFAGVVVYLFRPIIIPFILAIIIVYLIEPVVKRLSTLGIGRVRLPRWISVIVVYLSFFGMMILGGTLIIPPLAQEMSNLASEAPQFFEKLRKETIPQLNRDIQGLLASYFPVRLDEEHVGAARDEIYRAAAVADSSALAIAALTPEEREMFQEIGYRPQIVEPVDHEEPVAFRVHVDSATGDFVVHLGDVELVPQTEGEAAFVLRTRPTEPVVNHGSMAFDLEKSLDDTLADLVERSGQGVTELLALGQGLVVGILQLLVGFILTLMVAAFISIDLPNILNFMRNTIPVAARTTYDDLMRQLDKGLAGVVRGQLTICLVNGTLTAIGLLLFDVKFALILALLATVLSLIPIFGTILSTIPAVAMALTQGFSTALLVLGWILMIHFIEANILNPKIMGSSAHIHPVIVVFALLAGEHTYGLIGALLAVPFASVVLTLFRFVLARVTRQPTGRQEAVT